MVRERCNYEVVLCGAIARLFNYDQGTIRMISLMSVNQLTRGGWP